MLFSADLTQAQSVVSYDNPVSYDSFSQIEWIESPVVVYQSEIVPLEFATTTEFVSTTVYSTPITTEVVFEEATNPIYEVAPPSEVLSTAVQHTETKTAVQPVAHSTTIETHQPSAPVVSAPAPVASAPAVVSAPVAVVSAPVVSAPAPIVAPAPAVHEMTTIQPVVKHYSTHQPVCMSGG